MYRNKFKQVKNLGEGNFGVVFEVEKLQDGMKCAVKRIQLCENVEQIKKEFKTLAELSGKCSQIVGYFDVWFEAAEFEHQVILSSFFSISTLLL